MEVVQPGLEIADIFRQYSHLLENLSTEKHKVIRAITNCRTSVLGGHKLNCNSCDYKKISYNSCRNRFCPKCGFTKRKKWIEKRTEELLDCQYFHVVFTVPSELRSIMLYNQKVSYNILYKASSEALKEVAANPQHLGAEIGFIGILHTWGQNLMDHPHIHYIVPGGGLSKDRKKWIACKRDYLLPVKVFSKVFKAKLLKYFEEAYFEEKLKFKAQLEHFNSYTIFKHLLLDCAAKDFVVYAKKPFLGPEQVLNYLGNYTHRIAISNYRLVKMEDEIVYFKVRDKDNPGTSKVMKLHVKEFMRRFLLHVLPKAFVKIRHFGMLGNRLKKLKIKIVRKLQGIKEELHEQMSQGYKELIEKSLNIDIEECPKCEEGQLVKAMMFRSIFSSA